jgi:CheY-like chemotaxis protein
MAFSPTDLSRRPSSFPAAPGLTAQFHAAVGVRVSATSTADQAGDTASAEPWEGRRGLPTYHDDLEPQLEERGTTTKLGRRVLVVDDNRDLAESLAMVLRLWGHDVAVAFDGPEALQVARDRLPEVIFLDIGLPLLDGFEVARQLRSEPKTRQMRIIAVTGYGREEDRQRSRDVGIDLHLTKPVDPTVLQRLLLEEET